MNGGDLCQWALSVLTMGIEYIEATHLGKDLFPGSAVRGGITFDKNASRNRQFYIVIAKNMTLSPI